MKKMLVDPIRSIHNLSRLECLWSVDNEVLTALFSRFPASGYSDYFNYVTVNKAWVIFKLLVVHVGCLSCDQTLWLIGLTFCVSWDNTSVLINAINSDVIHPTLQMYTNRCYLNFSIWPVCVFSVFLWCLLKITLVNFNYPIKVMQTVLGLGSPILQKQQKLKGVIKSAEINLFWWREEITGIDKLHTKVMDR